MQLYGGEDRLSKPSIFNRHLSHSLIQLFICGDEYGAESLFSILATSQEETPDPTHQAAEKPAATRGRCSKNPVLVAEKEVEEKEGWDTSAIVVLIPYFRLCL